jgi:ribosome-binding protein aMBF1 (putative translation factor)
LLKVFLVRTTSGTFFDFQFTMIKEKDKHTLKDFGEHLKKLRKEKGLSLRELSYACNIDNSKISKMEHGKINPTLLTLMDLATALETTVTQLLDFK